MDLAFETGKFKNLFVYLSQSHWGSVPPFPNQ